MKQHFGICEWSMPVSGTLAMKLATEAGYEGMQLGEAGGRLMGYPLNNSRIQEIYRETAAQYGLILHSLNLGALLSEGTINYAKGTEKGDAARKSLANGIDVCKMLDINTIVITVDSKNKEAFENTIDHLKFASELSRDSGVEIAVESAHPLEQIERLLDRLDDSVRICMDILNPLRFGTGIPQEQIRVFGKAKVNHFHVKDSIKELFKLGQRGCVLLGQGDAGYNESVKIIKEIGYEGWIITENYYYLMPMYDGNNDFTELAAKDLITLKKSFL